MKIIIIIIIIINALCATRT